eukprot:364981-Chlamydomonas_euryale.AAC.2
MSEVKGLNSGGRVSKEHERYKAGHTSVRVTYERGGASQQMCVQGARVRRCRPQGMGVWEEGTASVTA